MASARGQPKRGGEPGAGVDAVGNAVVDPTANVIALNEAAGKRQDDLRAAQDKFTDSQLKNARELAEMRAAHVMEIGNIRATHMRDISDLRAAHNKDLAAAESSRVNAVRQVDVLAAQTSYDRANAAITTLATQTTQIAENLRVQQAAANAAVNDRISNLEKTSNIGAGRQTVTDPAMVELLSEVKALRATDSTQSGRSSGFEKWVGWIFAAAMAAIALYNKS